MSPNIFSCDPTWTKKLIDDQEKVVLVAWSEKSNMNGLTEKLTELEVEGTPVMVIDADNCSAIPESLGMRAGEVAVYRSGQQVGKITSSSDSSGDIVKVREIATR
jgi:CO dehydrogenase nickel-insertion accessory protein CooC1